MKIVASVSQIEYSGGLQSTPLVLEYFLVPRKRKLLGMWGRGWRLASPTLGHYHFLYSYGSLIKVHSVTLFLPE